MISGHFFTHRAQMHSGLFVVFNCPVVIRDKKSLFCFPLFYSPQCLRSMKWIEIMCTEPRVLLTRLRL